MNTRRGSCRVVILIWLFTGICGSAQAQRKFLYNDTALHRFYAALQATDSLVVSILHLGDSHVQAGFLPEAVAAPLRAKFGDAGRGWVFPYNLAGTNGPDGYRWSSNVHWEAERNVERGNTWMESPSGMLIRTGRATPELYFRSNPALAVRTVECFYDGPPVEAEGAAVEAGEKKARVTMDSAANAFRLRWPAGVTFYGAVLKSGEPGVLYNGIGVNGAQFSHYNKPGNAVAAQVKALSPQLVILSLGTNEAFGGITAAQLRQEMSATVAAIREHAPEACILFTTPPSGMMKKRQVPYRKKGSRKVYYRVSYTRNTQAPVIRDAMVQYCRENGFAYWDLYQLMPQDKRFARAWSGDRVHFNAYGYTLQGALLYEALEAGYSNFNH
jgi:lysophospholipase L1-like esterase